jgi:hypothetical protein
MIVSQIKIKVILSLAKIFAQPPHHLVYRSKRLEASSTHEEKARLDSSKQAFCIE